MCTRLPLWQASARLWCIAEPAAGNPHAHIHLHFCGIDGGFSFERSLSPLPLHKIHSLADLCVISLQAEGARGRGRGRGRGRRRRFHEEEEEAGITLEEWEAQQGDHSMSCHAVM